MKKLVSFALMLALSAALSATALAAEISETSKPQYSEVTVTTSISPTYTVSIPANTTVNFTPRTLLSAKSNSPPPSLTPARKWRLRCPPAAN